MVKGFKAASSFQKHTLLTTATIVVLLGIPAIFSLFGSPQKIDTTSTSVATRGPASIQLLSDSKAVMAPSSKSISKSVGCEAEVNLGALVGSYLRLRGSLCGTSSSGIEIKNKTNGFTASAIPLKSGTFTSDFIDLTEGENLIEISKVNSDGARTQQLIRVQRAPASLNTSDQGQ